MDELIKNQRDEGAEKNFKKMRWPCRSCMVSDDPGRHQNFMMPLQDFGVRNASDFITRLLPQGSWTRCSSCQRALRARFGHLGGELGGNTNNILKEDRKAFGKLGGELGGQLGGTRTTFPKRTARRSARSAVN